MSPLGKTSLTAIAAIHYSYPTANTSRYFMPRQELLNAMDEIVASRYAIEEKDRQIAEAARIIEGMKTRSAKLQEERDHALAMLNPKPETVAIVPAGAQMRGETGELPEG